MEKWFENKDKKYRIRYIEPDLDYYNKENNKENKKGLFRRIIDYIME